MVISQPEPGGDSAISPPHEVAKCDSTRTKRAPKFSSTLHYTLRGLGESPVPSSPFARDVTARCVTSRVIRMQGEAGAVART